MNNVGYLMAQRVSEEIFKLGDTQAEVARKLGCSVGLVRKWANGESIPSTAYLPLLHDIGADVMYILTGKRLWDKIFVWMDTALSDIPRHCDTCAYNQDCLHDACFDRCSECAVAPHCAKCHKESEWLWRGFAPGGADHV